MDLNRGTEMGLVAAHHTFELLVSSVLDSIPERSLINIGPAVLGPCDEMLTRYVLHRLDGNQVRAARALGVNRNTLRKRMQAYGIASHRVESYDEVTL